MAFTLTTRAKLRAAFLLLTGMEADDEDLTQEDAETNENVHRALQNGVWAAQLHLIDLGLGDDWLTTSSPLSWSGGDETGGQYATTPTTLLRFAGDETYSSLREADGTPWGRLLRDVRQRRTATGDWYYWAEGKLWVTKRANLPTTLYLDYYEKVDLPTNDDDAVDFPVEAVELAVAEAGYHAIHQAWFPGDAEKKAEIRDARTYWRTQAAQALRRTGGTQEFVEPETLGSHWMSF